MLIDKYFRQIIVVNNKSIFMKNMLPWVKTELLFFFLQQNIYIYTRGGNDNKACRIYMLINGFS